MPFTVTCTVTDFHPLYQNFCLALGQARFGAYFRAIFGELYFHGTVTLY